MSNIYIKIKHLKQFLLILACIFLASFNYLTYAETTTANSETCDKSVDSDCDGLTNTEEKLYGLNPDSIDTDGDGYSDGVEIKSGYDPLKAAPEDKIATGTVVKTIPTYVQTDTASLTEKFSQNLTALVKSKDKQAITTTDIKNLVEEQLITTTEEPVTLETLPDIDRSKIKILKQDYSALSNTARQKKEIEDAARYSEQIIYLFINNAPTQLATVADFSAFRDTFFSHLSDLSNSNDDSEYFSDLGNRLEIISNQALDVQVPETMLDMHIKFLRIIEGILTLRNYSDIQDDPIKKLLVMNRAIGYVGLVSDFFENDFKNYFEQLSTDYSK